MKKALVVVIGLGIVSLSYLWLDGSDTERKKEKDGDKTSLSSVSVSSVSTTHTEITKHVKDDEKEAILQSINRLLTCHKTQSCPVDNSDPRASEFLRRDKIVQAAQKLLGYSGDDVAAMARRLLAYEDGYVQEMALNLLDSMDLDTRNVDAMLDALEKSYDAKIVKQIMHQLQRYSVDNRFEVVFESLLTHGSIYAANTVARELLPFIQEDNIESYKAILHKLDANTKKAQLLKATLFEYEMQHSGG